MACVPLVLSAGTLLVSAGGAQGAPTKNPGYVGVVHGTNETIGVTEGGLPVMYNVAMEVTNEGGKATQENTLLVYPVIDRSNGALAGLAAYGFSTSFKPDGELYIEYSLYEPLQATTPLQFTGEYWIVGGTGSYAGATGTGTMAGLDFGDGDFCNRFNGTLVLTDSPPPTKDKAK